MSERSAPPSASVGRWFAEEEKHARHGDYAWLTERLGPANGRRVLEIGCGGGFSTAALLGAGFQVLTLEPEAACRAAAAMRCGARFQSVAGALGALSAEAAADILAFDPEVIVCWMIGVAEASLPPAAHPAEQVRLAREAIHRAVATHAVAWPHADLIHLADRTAFPWKIKDIGRETQVKYHLATTCRDLPLAATIGDALFRKLEPRDWQEGSRAAANGLPSGIVPVLGSLLIRRRGD